MKLQRITIGLALLAGCASFPAPSEEFRCERTEDCDPGRVCEQGYCVVGGEVDAGGNSGADAAASFDCSIWTGAPRHFTPCDLPAPSGALALDGAGEYVYNTADGTLTGPGGAPAVASKLVAAGRVISVESLAIGPSATLRVTGSQPLIVASWSTIDVRGTIDAGSSTSAGAGTNPTECAAHAALTAEDANDGASGGGGGGFQGAGGRGGAGDVGNPGAGGTAVAIPLLLGGCAGNRGGNGDQQNAGAGGAGGGAVQLTARQAITISGRLLAGGAGGAGASGSDGGGGGGGSGGMIGLEGASVAVSAGAILAANGGGGGQGSDVAPGGSGQAGAAGLTRSDGGTGGDSGLGGIGSGGAVLAGGLGQNDADHGAGGGGGGGGYIAVRSGDRRLDSAAVVSPAATIIP